MKRIKLLLAFLLFATATTYAQVGIGTAAPNQSAALEIYSSTKGLLIPKVSLTGTADGFNAAAAVGGGVITKGNVLSLLVYNTATAGTGATSVTPGYYYWTGIDARTGKWARIAITDDIPALVAAALPTATSVSNLVTTNSLVTTVNNVQSTGVNVITGNALALSADKKSLTSTVNGVISASLDISTAATSKALVVQLKNASYAAAATDDVVLVSAVAACTISLPSATANPGKVYYIKKTDSSANVVTVTSPTAGGIEGNTGATGVTLGVPNQNMILVSDGSNWAILSSL